ncbi:hypothetical protein BC937DRAFT_89751 [Endogone sp. FLAS-F59071]|nr:hypothetical protein BC937DRAFT_89751 [Endogone sp. FLAS-F59071]|eukprot:RUS17603.1 hypothetical protein BC937DRAFT_89751 [Endogone sp. FLAS-F59071]
MGMKRWEVGRGSLGVVKGNSDSISPSSLRSRNLQEHRSPPGLRPDRRGSRTWHRPHRARK